LLDKPTKWDATIGLSKVLQTVGRKEFRNLLVLAGMDSNEIFLRFDIDRKKQHTVVSKCYNVTVA